MRDPILSYSNSDPEFTLADMGNALVPESRYLSPKARGNGFYAVYDSCMVDNQPSGDLAFIEQRSCNTDENEEVATGEKYFCSLKEAKRYVDANFQSGAEYFSLKQTADPDNFFYAVIDKFTYLLT